MLEVRHDGVALRPAGAGGGVLYQWSHIKSWTPEDRAMVLEVREGLHQDFKLLEVRLDDPQAVVQALNAAVRAALQRHKVSGGREGGWASFPPFTATAVLTRAPRSPQRGNESRLTTVLEGDESEEEEEEEEERKAAHVGPGPASPGNGDWGPAEAHPGEGDSDSDDGPLMADDASPPARRAPPPPPPRHRRTLVEFSASRKEVWKGYLSVPKVLKSKVSWYSLQENVLLRRWQGAPGSISFQPLSELAVTPGRLAETSSTKATAGRKVFFEVLDPATGQWTLHKFQAKTEKAAALLREQLADVFARAREAASEPGPSPKPKPKPRPKPKPAPAPRPATEWEENPMKGLAAALGGGSPAEDPPSQGSPKDLIDFSFPDPPAPAGDPFPPAAAATPAATPGSPAPGSPSGRVDSAQLEDAVQTVAQTLQYLLDIETLRKNNATGSPVNAQLAAVGETARAIRDGREADDLPEDVTYFISTLQPTVPPVSAQEEVYNLTAHSLFDRVAMMEQDLRCLNEYFLPLRNARAERGEAGAEAGLQKLEVRVAKLEESFDAYRAPRC